MLKNFYVKLELPVSIEVVQTIVNTLIRVNDGLGAKYIGYSINSRLISEGQLRISIVAPNNTAIATLYEKAIKLIDDIVQDAAAANTGNTHKETAPAKPRHRRGELSAKILAFFTEHPEEDFSIAQVAQSLKLDRNTTNQVLRRLANEDKLARNVGVLPRGAEQAEIRYRLAASQE